MESSFPVRVCGMVVGGLGGKILNESEMLSCFFLFLLPMRDAAHAA